MPSKPKVVTDGPLDDDVRGFLNDEVELLPWETAGPDPVAIYTYGHAHVGDEMLDRLPGVKLVSNYGVGVDHIDVAACNRRGIPVGNTPNVLNGATADMGIALMLMAGRRMAEGERYARSDEFLEHDPGHMLGREVHSATLGIFGMGAIGREVAKRARAFDMTVLYYNRRPRPEVEQELDARYVTFDELLSQSDYVMLCCPLTEETRNVIDADALTKMKPTATLVNIARGGVVDTDALTAALSERKIYAAGLDVTEPEPLPRGHPMLALDNVTIMPHLGSATVQTRRMMAKNSVENLKRGLRGEPFLNEVKAAGS